VPDISKYGLRPQLGSEQNENGNCTHKTEKTPRLIEKHNIESLDHESTRYLYKNKLQRHIEKNPIDNKDDIDQNWSKVKLNILEAAQEAATTLEVYDLIVAALKKKGTEYHSYQKKKRDRPYK
jgi:hypothetical protein